jgi:hypothetical protein
MKVMARAGRPVDLLHESGRLAWSYRRPGQQPYQGRRFGSCAR